MQIKRQFENSHKTQIYFQFSYQEGPRHIFSSTVPSGISTHNYLAMLCQGVPEDLEPHGVPSNATGRLEWPAEIPNNPYLLLA